MKRKEKKNRNNVSNPSEEIIVDNDGTVADAESETTGKKKKDKYQYDPYYSPLFLRVLSFFAAVMMIVCVIICCMTVSKMSDLASAQPAAASSGNVSAQASPSGGTSSGGTATPSGSAGAASSGNSGAPSEDASSPSGAAAGDAAANEVAPEEVLKKYTEVMQQLKDGVATYDKLEFQTLPSDKYDLGSIGNIILPIANNFLTTEEKAQIQNRDDAVQIPIIDNAKGCLLTDVSQIQSASMTENGGKTTIVITLKSEDNPEPAKEAATSPSVTGAMFNPLSRKEIDDTLAGISAIKVNSFNLNYHDCTATLVFYTASGKVESLQQIMNVYIEANVKAVIVTIDGHAELINTMTINNIKYK